MAENVFKKSSFGRGRDAQPFGQRILFTGPDGIGDYRPRSVDVCQYIGEGPMPQGETGDLRYLWRPAPGTHAPKTKQSYVGAVGWGLQYSWALNKSTMYNNTQIKLGEFRTALEERVIFSYHNPWQPPPSIIDKLPAGSRGRLAWDHDINGEHFHEQYKQSLLNKNKVDQNTGEDASRLSDSSILDNKRCRTGVSQRQTAKRK